MLLVDALAHKLNDTEPMGDLHMASSLQANFSPQMLLSLLSCNGHPVPPPPPPPLYIGLGQREA